MEKYGKAGSIAEIYERSSIGVVPHMGPFSTSSLDIGLPGCWFPITEVTPSHVGHWRIYLQFVGGSPKLLSISIVTEIMERRSPPNTESHADQRLLAANTNAVPQKRIAGYDLSRAVRRKTKVVQIP
jgi:hypothetical protein